jgi:hypothetical protein
MKARLASLALSLSLFVVLASGTAKAALNPPTVGTVMTWTCTGDHAKEYVVKVASITDGVVRYQSKVDGIKYWAEKPAGLTGTTLWLRKNKGQMQTVDMEDFAEVATLRPGSRFKGAVAASDGDAKWVWGYKVAIGRLQSVRNPILGNVVLTQILEWRHVYHGKYRSEMTSLVEPNLGITVEWKYRDNKGLEHCVLSKLLLPNS